LLKKNKPKHLACIYENTSASEDCSERHNRISVPAFLLCRWSCPDKEKSATMYTVLVIGGSGTIFTTAGLSEQWSFWSLVNFLKAGTNSLKVISVRISELENFLGSKNFIFSFLHEASQIFKPSVPIQTVLI
jgi:hypothetical protein